MNKYTILALIGLVVAVLLVGYVDRPQTQSEQVYDACIKAKYDYTIFNDNYCQALQDDYGLEFKCNRNDCEVV